MTSSWRCAASSAAWDLLIGRERLLVVGIRLLETLQRTELIVRQAAIAIDIVFGTGDLGFGRGQLGRGLSDHCVLQPPGRVEIGERRLLPGDAGVRLRGRRGSRGRRV